MGDSGYAQRAYVVVTVPNAEESTPAAYYNKLHATARNTVVRAIGRLKGRFRCLLMHRVLHYHPDVVAKIVVARCVLHNICNRAGLPAPALNEYENQEELHFQTAVHTQAAPRHDTISQEAVMGQSSRHDLIFKSFSNALYCFVHKLFKNLLMSAIYFNFLLFYRQKLLQKTCKLRSPLM
ncbi:unnamed protein product [Euphydryas editha]|uniref:DDE Tnp4 domain-containing protein n=1 Tax=Euphydryas editha TaxID=104508 RepID=A0AAU9URM6_EUPED|nr:unnamed protein product [Euphydryas editha]